MNPATSPDRDRQGKATLSRELGEFLIEFSIGIHRFSMYPPGHPSLAPVAENIITRLADLFKDRKRLSVGVARDQLVIEGVATDPEHPVLRDLARDLHEHYLSAVTFSEGVVGREVEEFLAILAKDWENETGSPLGLRSREEIPSTEHIRIYPVGYDQIQLRQEGEGISEELDRATELWLGLAQAALAREDPLKPDEVPDSRMLAEEIRRHDREVAYDQVIVGYLLQLAEELKSSTGKEADKIREKVSSLIQELDAGTMNRLMQMGGDTDQRRQFVLDVNHGLAVESVVRVLQSAAEVSEQTISDSLLRLLSKLASHAEGGSDRVRDQASSALRENVEDLVEEWDFQDPNPDDYTLILDEMSRASPGFVEGGENGEEGEDGNAGARRLVLMSLEVGAMGPTVEKAVSDLVSAGEMGRILDLVDRASSDNPAANRIRAYLTDPAQVQRLLSGEDVDARGLRAVADRMGESAVPVLLDALTESDSRAVRRKVFDCLTDLELDLKGEIHRRLDDSRWYVVRNMLALVKEIETSLDGLDSLDYLRHPDPRVRREAFPLAVEDPEVRAQALVRGLSDTDERIVRMALVDLRNGVPETVLPSLVNRIVKGSRHPELRTLGVRALGHSDAPLALDALLGVVKRGRTLFGKPKLADASREVVAALEILRDRWADDPGAQEVLKAARRSRDPEHRRAAGGEGA